MTENVIQWSADSQKVKQEVKERSSESLIHNYNLEFLS